MGIKKTFIVAIALILLAGCLGADHDKENVKGPLKAEKISQGDLIQLIVEKGDFLLIDVRSKGEWEQGHIPGSIVIPYNEFDTRYNEIIDYKDQNIVLYCHVGGMGDYAGEILLKKGFKNVKNLEGGINGWIKSGGAIV